MPTHKQFLDEFKNRLPKFMQESTKDIFDDITSLIHESLKEDGVEIRGVFSMKAHKGNQRNTIRFRDLTSPQLLEQE